MGKILLSSLLCLSLVLAIAAVATADLCVKLGDFIFHGRGVAQPGAGACNVWKGYMHSGCTTPPITTGTVCGSSDNSKVYGNLTTSCGGAEAIVFDHFEYAKVGGAGTGVRYFRDDPPVTHTAAKVVCPANSIP